MNAKVQLEEFLTRNKFFIENAFRHKISNFDETKWHIIVNELLLFKTSILISILKIKQSLWPTKYLYYAGDVFYINPKLGLTLFIFCIIQRNKILKIS